MTFRSKAVKFDLSDVGSQVIEQLSTDVYMMGPGSILREAIKNACGTYLALESEELEEEKLERAVVISRQRHGNGTGHLFIEDNGIGQSFKDLRRSVRIRISRKPQDLEDATGFRGLYPWAILCAGPKIVIESTTKAVAGRSRLEMNVRRIYERMGIDAPLDDILNDPDCISFSTEECDKDDPWNNPGDRV
jgi:hypothetical protein